MASDEVALITGAGQRIGSALALALAEDGWRVAVSYARAAAPAEAVVAEIAARGGRAVALAADLADPEQVASLASRARAALGGPLTCLVNNAAIFEPDTALDVSRESFARHMTINLEAPIRLAQALALGLPAGASGHVVNIIDQRVWRLTPEFFSYTLSKSALWTATRTLAQALAPRIRVNAIGPGPVLQSVHQTPEEFAAEAAGTPLARVTTPEDLVRALRFILASPSLTGQMLAIDAGQHLEWRTGPQPAGRDFFRS